MNQRVIQFDVRLKRDEYVHAMWDRAVRERFLLRPTIDWPLSVDPLVWPSIFFSKIFRDATKGHYGQIEVDPGIDDGRYWRDLLQMKDYYRSHRLRKATGVPIAVSIFSDQPLQGDVLRFQTGNGVESVLPLGSTRPSEIPPDSEFLGYDIADASGLSGLCNCAYDATEQRILRPQWGPRLNSFGLLRTLRDAQEFSHLCNTRAREHAPFFIFGISRLQGV